ncbi:hypothetical protein K488DRAFT_42762 [Vararia minispora EC-137]|uniref:Uncharacterized protein n=1 Tax=Vararia minispora EC-137 TaxID=1314806 RepID=A0ACB8QWH1_9AGAM|nr:hypothetical protein K488DRAFT_42762 [Vararia minispora EC-137]
MGKYSSLHFFSTHWFPLPEIEPQDLSGRTVVVVGANVGLGLEAAKHFARMEPGKLVVVCRSTQKCDDTAEEIHATTGFSRISGYAVDLSVFASVIEFTEKFERDEKRLDILVYNAGIAMPEYERTVDGYEQCIHVNNLSCMLLSTLLLPRMLETAKASGPNSPRPRLVVVASGVHFWYTPSSDILSCERILEKYNDPIYCSQPGVMATRYYLTKLLNVLFVRELAERLPSAPIIASSVCPGLCKTSLGRNLRMPLFRSIGWKMYMGLLARSAEMGSRSIVWTAVAASHREQALHGHFTWNMEVQEESEFSVSKAGFAFQKKIWDETVQALGQVSPRFKEIVDQYLPSPQ